MLNILEAAGFLAAVGAIVWLIYRSKGKKAAGVKNVIEFPGEKKDA